MLIRKIRNMAHMSLPTALAAVLLLCGTAHAFSIKTSVLPGGGGVTASAVNENSSSIGQPSTVGTATDTVYINHSGFWHQAWSVMDPDHDNLTNAGEDKAGTDYLVADTDGDTFEDGEEVALGSDPLLPNIVPNAMACTDGGSIECLVRTDAGSDADNLDTATGKPLPEMGYNFTLIVTATSIPNSVRLYMTQRGSPTGYFRPYDMTCTGDFAAGATCIYSTKLGPAATHAYYFEVVMPNGMTRFYPESSYITGPEVQLLNGYNIVGIPRDLTGATLDGNSAFGSVDSYRWDPISGSFTMVDTDSPAIPGEGYFSFRQTATLPLQDSYGDIQDRQFIYELKPGWNLLSNPFSTNVMFQTMKFQKDTEVPVTWLDAIANGWIVNALYYFMGSDWGSTYGYAMGSDAVLTPWAGYWIYLNRNDGTYYMIVPKP